MFHLTLHFWGVRFYDVTAISQIETFWGQESSLSVFTNFPMSSPHCFWKMPAHWTLLYPWFEATLLWRCWPDVQMKVPAVYCWTADKTCEDDSNAAFKWNSIPNPNMNWSFLVLYKLFRIFYIVYCLIHCIGMRWVYCESPEPRQKSIKTGLCLPRVEPKLSTSAGKKLNLIPIVQDIWSGRIMCNISNE